MEITWGNPPKECKPGTNAGNALRIAIDPEVGLSNKLTASLDELCWNVSLYGEASAEAVPPWAVFDCWKVSAPMFPDVPLLNPPCVSRPHDLHDHCGVCGNACGSDEYCSQGSCTLSVHPGQSCNGLGDICGPQGNMNCCESGVIPGGAFPMGSDTDTFDSSEAPEHAVTVSSFRMDLFEVTVGRFRRFVDAYPASKPTFGTGADPVIAGSGWVNGWNYYLAADQSSLQAELACSASNATWTDTPGANEAYAINCVDWYTAFAFCAWDGGWLPTEAEWEYAAAGGDENREYPWGATAPKPSLANYADSAMAPFVRVESFPLGAARWGQYDMAGGVHEWAMDWYDEGWYAGTGNTCTNCANLFNGGTYRVVRGGDWTENSTPLLAGGRWLNYNKWGDPTMRWDIFGFRCARTP